MSIESGFDQLQLAADAAAEAVREARRRRDLFRRLENEDDVEGVVPSGSLARGTHNDPIHDVDLICVYDSESHPDWGLPGESALDALEHTRELIKKNFGVDGDEAEEVRRSELRNHAVKNFLDDPDDPKAFTVDVTPALEHSERGFLIPEKESNDWIHTDPEYLMELVANRHADWPQFAKLVRVLKRWNADHEQTMKSLVVEVLALDHLPELGRPQALARFFSAAAVAIWSPVTDPAGLCGEIQPALDRQAASRVLESAARRSASAVEAQARGEWQRAMCLWREVFGDIYPTPPDGCKEGAPLFIPAAPRRSVVDAPQG